MQKQSLLYNMNDLPWRLIPRLPSRDEEDEECQWWALPCGVESGMNVTPVVVRRTVRSLGR